MSFSRSIFMTGFPGFIAERLLEKLAAVDREFYLLVQPQFVEAALGHLERIAETTQTPLENYAVIEGDITQKELGIGPEDAETLADRVTDVFHLAAIYDLAVAREAAFAVNVEGTRNVNNFVAGCRKLIRYNHISTCYVAGKRTGRIAETDLEHEAGFRNFYEESKYLAEQEVEKFKAERPTTIFRPSVVVGDSQTGETAKYDGIYYLIQYLRKAPSLLRLVNVGNERVRLNLVPVDFVAEAIAALAFDERAAGKTLAIADPEPLTTRELFDSIAEGLAGRGSLITPPAKLVEWFLSKPFSPPITGLPLSGVPYFFIDQTYDMGVAAQLLREHGIECPGFRTYVKNLLRFVEEHPKL
ncbi:MAG: SDR family oxidoreductase [Pyrinomonadaceae bacterium]